MPGRNGGTPVEPGLIARLSGAARYVIAGVTPEGWMSPGQPVEPSAPPSEPAIRTFDYPVGANIRLQPRSTEPIGFGTLRALGDACELARILIEARKKQIKKLTWNIAGVDGSDGGTPARSIESFFRYPDREHDWASWLGLLLEEMLVIDAPSIYRRQTRGGGLYSLDVVDGATIKLLIDETGRTPEPPNPAYQQVIKGIPAWDLTTDELLYVPANVRANHLYGCSPVQQIMITVNTAIRRALFQYNYYQEGNIPDALLAVPETWTPAQLKEAQRWWDEAMAGEESLALRRKMKFIPGGEKLVMTKTAPLFDEADEWLARVTCFAFDVSPQPFIKQVNRATAGVQQEAAVEQGAQPTMQWVKSVMDRIVQRWFGHPELEFAWEDVADVDPNVQSQIDDRAIKNRSSTINEIRADRGDPPVPWGDEPPAPGKPEPDPDPIELEDDTGSGGDQDGVSAAVAEKIAAGRARSRRAFAP